MTQGLSNKTTEAIMIKRMSGAVILGAALFLLLALTSLPCLASGRLQVKVWTDKDTFLVHEPILVYYKIKNVGDSTFTLYETFDGLKEFFNIRDDKNRGYPNTLHSDYFGYSVLQPSESYMNSEEISSRYGVTDSGQYTCFLEVYGNKSNVLKIKITEPKGDERKALHLYLEAQKLHWCKDRDPRKWEQAFYKYLELAEKYPKSVYAPLSLYTALFKAGVIENKDVVISVCKKLIEEYPEFYYIDDTFYNLVGNYKFLEDKKGAMEYMKELIKRYPDTKISERAEYWLEKIEKWEFK
jgi:tetratricopeptide (TPR) repeat protein